MTESRQPSTVRRSGRAAFWTTLAGVLLVVVCGWLVVRFLLATPRMIAERAIQKEEAKLDLVSVVTQVRHLSRLETAAMRVTHVSTLTQSYGIIPDLFAGDELTLFAVGDVIAGMDLGEIRSEDVRLDGDVLVVHLPPARLLVSRLDNEKTRVVSRKTGILRREDIHLETRVRQEAEQSIRREALRRGILDEATEAAQVKLAGFLHTLGARKLRFETTPTPFFGPHG